MHGCKSAIRLKIGFTICAGLLLLFPALTNGAETGTTITEVARLSQIASQNPTNSFHIDLRGTVLWADAGNLVLQDASGTEALALQTSDGVLRPGNDVQLQGIATIRRSGAFFQIGAAGPVVDNNGVHPMIEKSGAVYLLEGMQPFEVDWFNGVEKGGLEIEYQIDNQPRQKISPPDLFRAERSATGATNFVNGLEFSSYEGNWEALPNFASLIPVQRGNVNFIDLSAASRDEHVALRFQGWLKIPRAGLYTFFLKSDDGSRLWIGEPAVQLILDARMGELPEPVAIIPGQILPGNQVNQWAQVQGLVTFAARTETGLRLELQSGTGRMEVEMARAEKTGTASLLNARVQLTGVCQGTLTPDGQRVAGKLLVFDAAQMQVLQPAFKAEALQNSPTNENALPVLTAAAEVHRLKREAAQLGYPVRIRGIVTSVLPEHQAFTIQDSSRGLYVIDFSNSRPAPPQPGEFLEVEGATDPSLFAPVVNATAVRSLGAGFFPEPARPTWDQLSNGSMDAQYVELQGMVTDVQTNRVTLRTEGGIIQVELRLIGGEQIDFSRFENALIRVRGALFASWDYVTHQVKSGELGIYGASVSLEEPPPADLFSIPAKSVPELRLFDPQASVFQRVKVAGQIVFVRGHECFLMQGEHGIRFVTRDATALRPGDLVKVVGFPDVFGSGAPVLREALAVPVGHAALLPPKILSANELLKPEQDATLVRLEGLLVNVREARDETVLEMQSGVRSFIARVGGTSGLSLTPGSRLELTGVYAAPSNNRQSRADAGSFELLLADANAIKVLARPPWWTLERLLATVGALALGLAVTVLWITQLRRKVEKRTKELGREIQERQQVEHQREMEQERSRIAQDLHDELGSGITEIGMLAARAGTATAQENRRSDYLEQMGEKAREMVTALDEIVWAMNPRHDSLGSLISYFSLYADRFLGLANISWRLEDSTATANRVVNSRVRHQLFLVFKEALTNVVRHSQATQVTLSIEQKNGELCFSVADNGRGLPTAERTEEMDGVANMRERMQRLDGGFEVISGPGNGTVVRFFVPARP